LAIRYLLDTIAVTALAHGNAAAWTRDAHIAHGDSLWTCFVVVGEWEYGLSAAPTPTRRAQLSAAGDSVFSALDGIWQSSPTHASTYGSVFATLRAEKRVIPTNDVWIAAVALVQGATLVTSDPHFARVPGLRLVDWTAA